jgi:hypothetical protein
MEVRIGDPDKAASYLWRMRGLAKDVIDPIIVKAYEHPGQKQNVPGSSWTVPCEEGVCILERD